MHCDDEAAKSSMISHLRNLLQFAVLSDVLLVNNALTDLQAMVSFVFNITLIKFKTE